MCIYVAEAIAMREVCVFRGEALNCIPINITNFHFTHMHITHYHRQNFLLK